MHFFIFYFYAFFASFAYAQISNLNDEEILISRLMRCVNYIIKDNCIHDKSNIKLFERKKNNGEKTLTKQNHLVLGNFKIPKGLKE